MYPATYNFIDDDVGDTWGSNYTEGVIIASLDGHRKVLDLETTAGNTSCYSDIDFTIQASGTIEFYFRLSHATNDFLYWFFYEDVTEAIVIKKDQGQSKLVYHNGVGYQDLWTGLSADTWYHVRLTFDCATDTFDFYGDGDLKVGAGLSFKNGVDGIDNWKIANIDTDTNYTHAYYDALGFSWDTDYMIGDNVHWRHYKESTDSFEDDDVGTQGTSITWVDGVDTAASFEIVPEFGVHKKVLRGYYSSAVGGYDQCSHAFTAQSTSGWFSCWVKSSDVSAANDNRIELYDSTVGLNTNFRINAGKFRVYTGGAWQDVTGAPAPEDNTWYFLLFQWYADDTFDIWIDNILYEDGIAMNLGMGGGINRVYIRSDNAATYFYIDAPMSSLDSDSRGDNRTYDYNDTYTRIDITANIINATMENALYTARKGVVFSTEEYTKDDLFFQLYDINSALAIEGEIKYDYYNGAYYSYTLRDKNFDELHERLTDSFTTAAIHDATSSTCIVKTFLDNVAHANGRLLLVNADAEAATYSPTLRNYPLYKFLRDMSDMTDSCFIIEPTGKIDLDDDKASGDSYDVDTDGVFLAPPKIMSIQESINYYEIYGAINPDTGQRFYKIVDNSGTDEPRKWRITKNNLLNQTDVDAYATAVSAKVIDVNQYHFRLQGVGCYNMGETITIVYDLDNYSINGTYYIISEKMNFDTAVSELVLSDGLLEKSLYSQTYESSYEETNAIASEIYETDITTISLALYPANGAATGSQGCVEMDNLNEVTETTFYIGDNVDTSRDIKIYFGYVPVTNFTDGHINVQYYILRWPNDCSTGTQGVLNTTEDVSCTTIGKFAVETKEVSVEANNLYLIDFALSDNNPAELHCYNITVQYYIKRSLS